MKSTTNIAAGLLITLFSLPAAAADPTIVSTWDAGVGTKTVYVYSGMPAACDNPTLYGLNVWNDVGAAFAFGWNTANPVTAFREFEVSDSEDKATIYVEDRVISDPTVYMQTEVSRLSGTIVDMDIFVNDNYLFYGAGTGAAGTFYCPAARDTATPAGQTDFQSAIEHEFGHTIGFQLLPVGEYYGNADCVMYYALPEGVTNRSLCFGEYNEFRLQYGVR